MHGKNFKTHLNPTTNKGLEHDSRTWLTLDGWCCGADLGGASALLLPQLDLADGIRRTQPIAIGIYQLVPRHGDLSCDGDEGSQLLWREV